MRSRVVPTSACCRSARVPALSRAGNCTTQLGAYWASSATRRSPPGPRHSRSSASNRQIGFARAVLLNALTVPNPQPGIVAQPLHKRLYQGRFPDACLAGHEDHVPLPVQGLGVQAV